MSSLLAHQQPGGAPAASVASDAGLEIAGRRPPERAVSTAVAEPAAGGLWARLRAPLPLHGIRCEAPCALIGAILLLGIFLLDGRVGSQGTFEALAALPVLAATRLLPRRLLLPLVTLAITLDLVGPIVHDDSALTAVTQASVLLVLCAVGRGATVSWMRLSASERRARDLAAEHRRAVELDESKSDFLRLASHEVRAPLTVLLGYIGLLEDGMFGEMPSSARSQVLPVLRSKVDELVALSEAMLQAARLDDGRLELTPERVDVRELAGEAASRVEPMLGPSHRLGVDCPPSPVMVVGDRLRLVTVLVNLLANAVKYSPAGGEVRCAVRVGEGLAVVTVSDQGIGIDPDDLPRLFQRFTRVASGVDAEIPGTGLGLYIARQLARKHGGDIIAASKRGVGSSFTVSLPLAG
ncbi:MAG TPA: HAMP domain-containing sensor histidine kinase [Candidatus Dormibacteraeota bacterium]